VPHKITRTPWPILAILVAIVGVEGVLLVVPGALGASFALFAFDPRLMEVARPLYPGQGMVMFVSHVFVHIGPLHMLGNAVAIYLLWYLMPWMYTSDFLMVFLGGALGGALIFAWFGPPGTTMTGVSGAATALAAVWGLYEMFLINRGYVLSLRPKRTAVLVGLVAVGVFLNLDHQLNTAWQVHVGGAIAGAAFGVGLIIPAIIEKRTGPTDPREKE
jgi:membrane associated rhomboid family serine protease